MPVRVTICYRALRHCRVTIDGSYGPQSRVALVACLEAG